MEAGLTALIPVHERQPDGSVRYSHDFHDWLNRLVIILQMEALDDLERRECSVKFGGKERKTMAKAIK